MPHRTYEFHRPHKKPVKRRISSHHDDPSPKLEKVVGSGGHGRSERIVVKNVHDGRRNREVAYLEKKFYGDGDTQLMPKIVFVLNYLKKYKFPVIPIAALAKEMQHKSILAHWDSLRLIMSDLTHGGKFTVVDYKSLKGTTRNSNTMAVNFTSEVASLKNFEEIRRDIEYCEKAVSSLGFKFAGFEWLIVIDPKHNIGRPVIADVKDTVLSDELEKELKEWQNKIGL